MDAAFNDIIGYFNFGHYLTESERKAIEDRYKQLEDDVSKLIDCDELKESGHLDLFTRFDKAMSDTEIYKLENNDRFKEKQLAMCKDYFDSVLAYPLDEQQRDADIDGHHRVEAL